MSAIIRVKDSNGNVFSIPAIKGDNGDPADLATVQQKASIDDADLILVADSTSNKAGKLVLWSTIKAALSNLYLGTSGDASNVTNAFTVAATKTDLATGEKLSVSLGKIQKWFSSLGTAAFTASTAYEAAGNISTHNAAGDAHSTLFAGKQSKITASGLLKGAGDGTVSAAARGTDYSLVNAPVIVSVPYTGWVKNATTNAYEQSVTVAGLLATDDKRTRVEIVGSTDVAAQALIDTAAGNLNYVACNINGQLYLRCDKAAPATTFSVAVVIAR